MGDRDIPSYRKGRTYADFELYMTQHPDAPVVEREEKFSISFIPNLEPRPMDDCFLYPYGLLAKRKIRKES